MINKRFISTLLLMLLLFVAVIGGAGCDSGSSSNSVSGEEPNNSTPTPDSSPTPTPETPEPTPTPDPEITFTITFNSNGGSQVEAQVVSAGKTATTTTAPTRDGYIFAGWYKDDGTFEQMFIFGSEGEKVTRDITLYAKWTDIAASVAQFAVSEIVIGYQGADKPNYVTQNLTLPTKINDAEISWVSSSGAVSSGGVVTRQNTDTEVTLTATASYNGRKSDARTFTVRVIKKRTKVNSEIQPLTLDYASSGDIEVTRNASGNVTDIEGVYVSFDINNADDALDAVTVIKNELGIKNPANELETFLATSDSSGAEYQFQQVHNGVKVYGRSLMASTNANGDGDFLHSNLLSSDIIARADGKADVGQSTAENNAKTNYTGSVTVDTAKTERIIYSLGDYKAAPVYAYIVNVSGINGNGDFISERVFVNASTGATIDSFSNIHTNSLAVEKVGGNDELGNPVSFDVFRVEFDNSIAHVMTGNYPRVQMYLGDLDTPIIHNVGEAWNDGQSISAYINMCDIINWWKESFDRNSLDNKGMIVKVVAHEALEGFDSNGIPIKEYRDNAFWEGEYYEAIFICEKSSGSSSKYKYSMAAGIDILVHETTHAVIDYDVPGGLPYENATGAVNEGYADVFGCVKDQNWLLAEKLYKDNTFLCMRNISWPGDDVAKNQGPSKIGGKYYIDYVKDKSDHGGVHTNSFIISHAAYLMHEDKAGKGVGLTWDELGQVWYKSIHTGLNSESTFQDVRRCVIWAAKKLHISEKKLEIVRNAFEEVGITETKGTLNGAVSDYDSREFISGANVTVFENTNLPYQVGKKTTPVSGRYSFSLEAGQYMVLINKSGYVTFSGFPSIETASVNEETRMNVQLVKPGAGSVSGTILNSSDKLPIEGVTLNIRSSWFVQNATIKDTTTTDSNGRYTFDLGDNGAGYYTIEMIKDGYKTSTFNVTLSGVTTGQNGYLESESTISENDVPIDAEHFPDPVFRKYLGAIYSATELNIDKNNDGVLSEAELNDVTRLDWAGYDISDLTGIEYFKNIKYLDCSYNYLKTLDVSKNTALEKLYCYNNQLTALNISGITTLTTLDCSNNNLTVLDVSGNTNLVVLKCGNNQLTNLNVTQNTVLETLYCFTNKLTVLDVSRNLSLRNLSCGGNKLTALDVSRNSAIEFLYCANNNLTELDVSHCTKDVYVRCDSSVVVIYPASTSSVQSTSNTVTNNSNSLIILATIPQFTATHTGEHVIDVSLDKEIPEDSRLLLLNASEDLNGVFVNEGGSNADKYLKVSADLEAGQTYSLLIAAESEEISENGSGCNLASLELLSLLFVLGIHKKKRLFQKQ